MRVLRALSIALLCVSFTPGASELVLDASHALAEGHTHHADGHEEAGPEHGCTGWQHTCPCHVSMSVAPSVRAEMPRPWPVDWTRTGDDVARGPVGVRASLERPPRA